MSDAYIIKRGGSGGGDDNYAIINITYDVGEQLTVTHNGETYEAPDTSGVWLFGCEENGSYVCSMTAEGITASKTVTISAKGQVVDVSLTIQIAVNYKMLYYLGDECTDITGGWNMATTITPKTVNAINNDGYDYYYLFGNGSLYTELKTAMNGTIGIGIGHGSSYGFSETITKPIGNTNTRKKFSGIFEKANSANTNIQLQYKSDCVGVGSNVARYAIKDNNYLSLTLNRVPAGSSPQTSSTGGSNYYSIGFAKEDDISGLSAYGNTINAIISNATNLFKDVDAVKYIARRCTGNFMVTALCNTTFVNTMNSSANKTILLGNEHWAKFIALLSV